jgi:hypothetical protein
VTTDQESISLELPTLPIILGKKVREGLNSARGNRDWNRAILIDVPELHYQSESGWSIAEGPVYIGQLCAMHGPMPGERPLLHIELDPMPPEDVPGMEHIRGPHQGFFRSQSAAKGALTRFARMMAFLGVWRTS